MKNPTHPFHRIHLVLFVFCQVLRQDPKNGFALVHLGFIVKTGDRDYTTAIPLLRDGIASNVPGVIDGRFFLQLGDALFRTGQHNEVELSLSTMAHGSLSYLILLVE